MAAAGDRLRVVLDGDPGHDDLIAIAVAARHAALVGITAVAGNAPLAATALNARRAVDLFGLHVPVHAGADRPLLAEPAFNPDIHGSSGLDGPEPFDPATPLSSTDAVGFLIESARAAEGLWLVVTGPMTNVALALRAAPDFARRLGGISFMGGSAARGNVTASAEFNVGFDPEAAALVIGSGVPLRMCGLHLSAQVEVDASEIAALRAEGSRRSVFVADCLGSYLTAIQRVRQGRAVALHDPCAVLGLTHPQLFAFAQRRVDVELTGAHTRGMTVVDQRGSDPPERRNVLVADRIDGPAAKALIFDAVRDPCGRGDNPGSRAG